ncbi:MAG TPA: ankyrin repeat domain-containing protein, partial [Gemmatimonadaceae bacterium]|nr:ankyrin repeat domain-containing protein [Gemmatimonadaceae bacterium]
SGATALHHAAIRGQVELVRALLAARPDLTIRDRHHRSSPLGWACYGADFVRDEGGDYTGCVRALIDAGARFVGDEWRANEGAVAEELRRAGVG